MSFEKTQQLTPSQQEAMDEAKKIAVERDGGKLKHLIKAMSGQSTEGMDVLREEAEKENEILTKGQSTKGMNVLKEDVKKEDEILDESQLLENTKKIANNPDLYKADKYRAEKIKMLPPLSVIYRDNDVYEKLIPGIVANLQSFGMPVNVKSFPRGSKEEIKSWFEEPKNQDILHKNQILLDDTSRFLMPDELRKDFEKNHNKMEQLDTFSHKIVFNAFYGKIEGKALGEEMSIEEGLNHFERIMKIVLAEDNNKPKEISIVTNQISAHRDGFQIPKEWEGSAEDWHNFVAQKLKDVLVRNGIEENTINIIPEMSQEYDKDYSWYIADRHASSKKIGDDFYEASKALKLPLPFDSMIRAVEEKIFANMNKIDWKEISKDAIDKRFIPQPDIVPFHMWSIRHRKERMEGVDEHIAFCKSASENGDKEEIEVALSILNLKKEFMNRDDLDDLRIKLNARKITL